MFVACIATIKLWCQYRNTCIYLEKAALERKVNNNGSKLQSCYATIQTLASNKSLSLSLFCLYCLVAFTYFTSSNLM